MCVTLMEPDGFWKLFQADDADPRLPFELALYRLIDVLASEVVIKDSRGNPWGSSWEGAVQL